VAGILIDADVPFARDLFGGRLASAKLEDPQVVMLAWKSDLTIVTANGADFTRYFLEHQRRHPCTKNACHDMSGLIVLPNPELKARNAFQAVTRRNGLRAGGEQIDLDAIWYYNLYAKYHVDGSTEVKRFPRCPYREDLDEAGEWYEKLPVVGAS
jgi:hypothetical protein